MVGLKEGLPMTRAIDGVLRCKDCGGELKGGSAHERSHSLLDCLRELQRQMKVLVERVARLERGQE
jgi:hypothetical protein